MSSFMDTSFLCAAYREQRYSQEADRLAALLARPAPLSPLVAFEFRQSTRLQARLFENDRTKGFSNREADAMLEALRMDYEQGIWKPLQVDWASVLALAEVLSARHTRTSGNRFADTLHVATALQAGARIFLTFDIRQQKLAAAEGFETPLEAVL
jgi:predicted nucleic acid-binding protein